jgi:mono/diheme cytochrome c family protein
MTDKELRPLLAIAQAKLTLGLLVFAVAITLLAGSTIQGSPSPFRPGCGVVDSEHPLPVKPPMGVAVLDYQRGEKLFKANCASCHKPDMKLTGPALKGSKDRWEESGGDIYAWVKNSPAYLKANASDQYAHDLFKEFGGSIMTPNAVSNEDIDAILYYADNYRQRQPSQRQVIAAVKAQDDQFVGYFAQ